MAIFTEKKKINAAPRTQGSIEGENFLRDRLQQVPTLPTRSISDLSPIQLAVQQYLMGSLDSSNDAAALARDEYKRTLSDEYDPETSKFYKATRDTLERSKTGAITADRQRAQGLGGLHSTPAAGVESDTRLKYDSMIGQVLGQLQESERNKKLTAAEGIQKGAGAEVQNLGAISNVADLQRVIEQQRADALYSQALNQILLPYDTMAGIAQALMNYQMPTYTTGGGLTDLGFLVNASANAAGAFAGAGGFG